MGSRASVPVPHETQLSANLNKQQAHITVDSISILTQQTALPHKRELPPPPLLFTRQSIGTNHHHAELQHSLKSRSSLLRHHHYTATESEQRRGVVVNVGGGSRSGVHFCNNGCRVSQTSPLLHDFVTATGGGGGGVCESNTNPLLPLVVLVPYESPRDEHIGGSVRCSGGGGLLEGRSPQDRGSCWAVKPSDDDEGADSSYSQYHFDSTSVAIDIAITPRGQQTAAAPSQRWGRDASAAARRRRRQRRQPSASASGASVSSAATAWTLGGLLPITLAVGNHSSIQDDGFLDIAQMRSSMLV
ncbi:Hypothetical protein, putative [Bodo saltans]|uniref:Uncharacterized protein n=1 Tax=Bodo saltans TaxID=75058 RepID=A0A0S4KL47_BODSA|nr:Hypothetical protein, putative [Bodo saltans]|eukprot:CUI14311.1 Hypothetical protein, putative [Bodo saltans]